MRKALFFIFVTGVIVLGYYAEDQFLWCTRLFSNDPNVHTVQKGEYFSKLSQHYYGTAEYWKELALVNRAPNSNLVFPGEKIIIPGVEAIKKLHKTQSLTVVNDIVNGQENWLAEHRVTNDERPNIAVTELPSSTQKPAAVSSPTGQVEQQSTKSEKAPVVVSKKSTVPWLLIWTLVAVAAVIGGGLYYMYGRKSKRSIKVPRKKPAPGGREKFESRPESFPDRKEILVT
ncbi:LysM peptidoglycan-binding domain-containing protein [candidate division KSB1 bacterium]|nr:LysM peptidoglycan-binding domain-containing protein [candidate division KSB1 bacterium]